MPDGAGADASEESTTAVGVAGSFGDEADDDDVESTGEQPAVDGVAAAAAAGGATVAPFVNPQLRAAGEPGSVEVLDEPDLHEPDLDGGPVHGDVEGSSRVALAPPRTPPDRTPSDRTTGPGDDVFGLAAAVSGGGSADRSATAERPAVDAPFSSVPPEHTTQIATLGAPPPDTPDDDLDAPSPPPRRSRRGPLLLALALLLAVGVGVGCLVVRLRPLHPGARRAAAHAGQRRGQAGSGRAGRRRSSTSSTTSRSARAR